MATYRNSVDVPAIPWIGVTLTDMSTHNPSGALKSVSANQVQLFDGTYATAATMSVLYVPLGLKAGDQLMMQINRDVAEAGSNDKCFAMWGITSHPTNPAAATYQAAAGPCDQAAVVSTTQIMKGAVLSYGSNTTNMTGMRSIFLCADNNYIRGMYASEAYSNQNRASSVEIRYGMNATYTTIWLALFVGSLANTGADRIITLPRIDYKMIPCYSQ